MNPFSKLQSFLMNDVVEGLLNIVTPLAIIGILVSAIGMYLSTEEHNRERFKKSLISISIVTIIAFMAQGIIKWLEVKF